MQSRTLYALLASDRAPNRQLAETLSWHGYGIDFSYSLSESLFALDRRKYALSVVGPLRERGWEPLLLRLRELAVPTIVVTDDHELLTLAEQLGFTVRTPPAEPAHAPSLPAMHSTRDGWSREHVCDRACRGGDLKGSGPR